MGSFFGAFLISLVIMIVAALLRVIWALGGGTEALLEHAVICDEAIRLTAEREGQTPPTEAEQRAPRMRKMLDSKDA